MAQSWLAEATRERSEQLGTVMFGICTSGLSKTYSGLRAVRDLTFEVPARGVCALLGVNGSGKTTTTRLLTGLATPDSGSARVAGYDIVRQSKAARAVIGFTAQETRLDPYLTGAEYLDIIGRLRHVSRPDRRSRTRLLLDALELTDVSRNRIGTYSGGMARRLDIAGSLLGRPRVLFLDEPSTGLDPHSRRRLWDVVRREASGGTTVLLTTQYMDEADALADWVIVLGKGRIVAQGRPDELGFRHRARVAELTLAHVGLVEVVETALRPFGVEVSPGPQPGACALAVRQGDVTTLIAALARLHAEGVPIVDVSLRRPTLEEVFLALTTPTAPAVGAEEALVVGAGRG
jgi:ABC-type multidrug transport system ATPase subunit